jgi:hypothetical protein
VYVEWFSLHDGESTVWWTTNLEPSTADTVLHIFDWTGGYEAAVGFDYYGSPMSLASLTNTTGGARLYAAVVRADDAGSAGYADIFRDGQLRADNVPFGGTFVDVPGGPDPYRYEASYGPGANSVLVSELFALGSTGHLLDMGSYKGVGLSAAVEGEYVDQVVVSYNALFQPPPSPVVDLYANDWWDFDGDGLGWYLEQELETCEAFGSYCDGVFNEKDSDHDGLEDGAEVFGVEAGWLYFRRWGADPLHKDAFVQVDYYARAGEDLAFGNGNPFEPLSETELEDWVETVSGKFEVGPVNDVQNPDGLDGITVHIDAGVDLDGYETTFVDMGGGGPCTSIPDGEPVRNTCYADGAISSERKVYFHYALAENSGGGGQTGGTRLSWGFGADGNPNTFSHEFGHSLSLQHWGHDRVDRFPDPNIPGAYVEPKGLNCKPHYPSTMNYALPLSAPFSTVGREEAPVLNSSSITEVGVFDMAGFTPPNLDSPTEWEFNLLTRYGDLDVDWNRSDAFSAPNQRYTVRDSYAPDCWTYFGEDQMWLEKMSEYQAYSGTPKLVLAGSDWLYLFWVENSQIYYRVGNTNGRADGSCPLGDQPNSRCMDWSARLSFVSFTGIADVAVSEWDGVLYIVYRYAGGSMYLRRATINPLGNLTVSAGSFMGYSDHTPELVQLNVDDSVASSRRLLALLFSDEGSSNYRFRVTSDPAGGSWSAEDYVRTTGGTILTGERSPSAVPWPSAAPSSIFDSRSTTCALFPNTADEVKLYCLDRDNPNLRWVDRSSRLPTLTTSRDPHLAYRYYRKPDSTLLYGSYDYGQFFVTYGAWGDSDGGVLRYALTSDLYYGATPMSDNWSTASQGYVKNIWHKPIGESAGVVYDHPSLGAAKGASFDYVGVEAVPQLHFHPLADGTWDVDLHSESDFRIMGDGMCRQIRAADFCGTFDQTTWGY